MAKALDVEVEWDAEASVWIAACPGIGLFTEADTLDELRRKIPLIASDLLSDDPAEEVELSIEMLVRYQDKVSAAA